MERSEFYNDYKQARNLSWEVLIKQNIQYLPVDLKQIFRNIGIKATSYEKGKEIIDQCGFNEYTINDGFSIAVDGRYYIFCDGNQLETRLRFTLAHELGHILLGHVDHENVACRANVTIWNKGEAEEPNPLEAAANVFASRLLAPACVLHSVGATTPDDIAGLCGLSRRAAEIRARRMEELEKRNAEWIASKGYGCFGLDRQERQVLLQFRDFIEEYQVEI